MLTVKVAPNAEGFRRFGVIVPKAVAKSAVRRNRLKRLAYGVFGGVSGKAAEDVIVILKPPAASASAAELEEKLLPLPPQKEERSPRTGLRSVPYRTP